MKLNIFQCVVCLIVLVIMIFIGCKIHKLIRKKDKIIIAIIVFICLDLTANCYFYVVLTLDREWDDYFSWWHLNVAAVMPLSMLTIAIVLNLRNWIYYFLKIGEMAYL